jgi:predicted AAA+ superfamily ATPase
MQLQDARRALALGETHRALWHCLHLLEGWNTPADQSNKRGAFAPYMEDKWKGTFDVDENKDAALQRLTAGIASYLNKVGHHRSRTETDEQGDWKESPVDHYEAEVLVSMTQLLVACLARVPRKP